MLVTENIVGTEIASETHKTKSHKFVVYLLVFLMALHITPAAYINSSFLSQFIGEENVGYIFTFASLITIGAMVYVKIILQKIGNYRVFMSAIMVDLAALIILSTSIFVDPTQFASLFIAAFIIGNIAQIIMIFNMDIFLEHVSSDKNTGGIRGIYLTSLNLAYVIGPFIASLLITDVIDAGRVYVWGAIMTVPIIFLTKKFFHDFKDSHYKRSRLLVTIKTVFTHHDLSKICVSDFLLKFFYSWMVIYTPIFLHSIGFSLAEVGMMMSFALLPFILLQLPMGKIADKYFGEKEILTLGFIISGIFTASMFVFDDKIFWLWAAILFITRIGASMIEVMNETYLFKKITDVDVDILTVYRSIAPLTYATAPIVASILLIYLDIHYLFLVMGIMLLCGVIFSTRLRDTL